MGKSAFWTLIYFASENDWSVATWSLNELLWANTPQGKDEPVFINPCSKLALVIPLKNEWLLLKTSMEL